MKLLLVMLMLISSFSTIAKPCDNLNQLSGLLGKWQSVQAHSTLQEQWHRVSDNTFEGSGETYTDQWQHNESLRLLSMPEGIYYLAKVTHNPLPVAFKLTHCKDALAVFENHDHDFPNKIEYHFIDNEHIRVAVSGQDNQGFEIKFTRMNETNYKDE
ncbi:DUF6265 family protein [Shewanella phaeophyticola]|uniref:DUF6265 family protein n=1 Tax=Shewanella phaeophyticola TaxID=2978345 RepID=A0ABT2P1D4_9GAMM|nr:DUF6265 family protein [Shewanella sp. KJ10-1]MCT8986211.1 DUF6265 family protein [Shewanella sp. KJ10-1]